MYDAGDYALSIVLHYASGHGLRNPGVGGQEDVIEYLVPGSPFLVRASESKFETCSTNKNNSRVHLRPDTHTPSGHDSPHTHEHQPEVRSPYDPTTPRRLCKGSQAVAGAGRWINRRLLCPCVGRGGLAPGFGRQCDFADEEDDWVCVSLSLSCVCVSASVSFCVSSYAFLSLSLSRARSLSLSISLSLFPAGLPSSSCAYAPANSVHSDLWMNVCVCLCVYVYGSIWLYMDAGVGTPGECVEAALAEKND